jgi:cyclophilin family peptidyl-prolyl cis-trans isomerase/HEAT repeat protein
MRTRLFVLAAASLVAGSLAASCRELGGVSDTPARPGGDPQHAQAVPTSKSSPSTPQDPRAMIALYEDSRSDGDGLLETFAADGAESTRVRAVFALGRMPFPEEGVTVTRALCAAAKGTSERVRAAALFGLGLRGDPAAADTLVEARNDPIPDVRARAVEAASRIDEPRMHGLVLGALSDEAEIVRAEAAVGPSRWKRDAPDADAVDTALVAAASATKDVDVAWRALSSLARRRSAKGAAVFAASITHVDARMRIFSAQGLKVVPVDAGAQEKLRAALADPDWRVACEAALAIGEHPDAAALPALEKALAHSSSHVRRCAAEALAHFVDAKEAVRPILARAKDDASVDVRCSVLVARAQLDGDALAGEVEKAAASKEALWRAGAAGAAGSLSNGKAIPLLLKLTHDSDPHVVDVAAHALKGHATPEVHARLVEMLGDADNGVRLAAVDVLKDTGEAGDLDAFAKCLSTSRGDISGEIASGVVDAAARIGGEPARPILERGAFHTSAFVRQKSRAALAKDFPGTKFEGSNDRPASPPMVPLPDTDYPTSGPNPRVEVVTNRGTMVFELLRNECPVHVFNFMTLARRGFYDGTTFHRVVPDFVIQGGDRRGDGNGGATWRGEPLRGEFTPRKFARGSLGMPRNDDPDSGGSQIFVTHRETPHLDGRYTLFGELRDGFEVLDSIELGDTIRTVRVVGDPSR